MQKERSSWVWIENDFLKRVRIKWKLILAYSTIDPRKDEKQGERMNKLMALNRRLGIGKIGERLPIGIRVWLKPFEIILKNEDRFLAIACRVCRTQERSANRKATGMETTRIFKRSDIFDLTASIVRMKICSGKSKTAIQTLNFKVSGPKFGNKLENSTLQTNENHKF